MTKDERDKLRELARQSTIVFFAGDINALLDYIDHLEMRLKGAEAEVTRTSREAETL